ncbi:MAG: response regulator transcription factor [Erysipelotrichia bacterium]|nr:response regulator transcription factor [Erysipelotrichia bacterium]
MIAVVEDDESIRDIELYTLKTTGFHAIGFPDGESFFAALKHEIPELVILDVMLPNEDGLSILRKLRASAAAAKIPVILATARGSEYDKVNGLDLGADDYLVKPFGMMEMISRVRAVLRRTSEEKPEDVLSCGSLRMDRARHTVTSDNKPVMLTLKEYELLHALMKHPGMVYTRDQLLNDIWGMEYDGETRTVDVHVRTLRQKLGKAGECIETVRGIGYRLAGNKV